MKLPVLIGALVLSLSVLPAQAQGKDDTVASVRDSTGEIRASRDGAEFAAATQGQRVKAGDRILVGQDSVVTLRFDNSCTVTYDTPGVFTVDSTCVAGVLWGDAAKVAGGTAVVAAMLSSMDKRPGPPASR